MSVALTLDQHSVLSFGRAQSKLIKCDDLTTSLKDTSTGTLGHMQSTYLVKNNNTI